ncbi:hypothetical protein BC332_02253 [Capsicum chinense]|nr:hypothetical protein BC332_02253 [Capsicum chinense]
MPFFLTLRSVQTLSDPKVVDGIKMELFGATTITRKIILEGGLVVVNDGSRSGAIVGLMMLLLQVKHDGVINVINVLTAFVKKKTSKRGVIPSKRISYPDISLKIKVAKSRRKDTSKASSSINKGKIVMPLSLYCNDVQCTRATGEQHELKKMDVTVEATAEEHNIIADNPSIVSNEEEKVEPVSLEELKNYPFEGFNISDEALKQLTQLIKDYSEWIADGLLKHHAGRYCQQQPEFSLNEECLINIIKGFSNLAGLPWVNKVYIPINYGDEFHWMLAVVVLKERRIRVYDSMSRRRRSGPSFEIQNLAKILPTYLDMRDFLDQKVRTDWSMIIPYQDKMANPFYVQYVEGIAQQTIGILDCGPFVAAYAEYLSDGL